MTTIRSIIEKLQVYNPDDTIENLLQDPGFVRVVAESIHSLPKTSRATVSKIIGHRGLPSKQDSQSVKALKAIQKVEEINLPSKVSSKYKQCQQCPSSFWAWAGIRLDLNADETNKPIRILLGEAYLGISNLEIQREWDTINWRFFVLFFHDLMNCLDRRHLTKLFEDELVGILSSSELIIDTTTNIRNNLKRWVSAGSHYSVLSDSLGKGAPFLLPQSVTDKTWENGLPLDGPIYTSAIKHLKSKFFCRKLEELDANALGAKIRETIFKPFQWHLSTFEQSTHSNSHQSPTETGGSASPCPSPGDVRPISTQNIVTSQSEAFHNHREGGTEAESNRFGNRSSINALLNPADLTQGQQLSPVASSSFAIGGETGLIDYEKNTASKSVGVCSSRIQNRGLNCQSQAEADGPPNKRRRLHEFSSHDSSIPQPSNQTPDDANNSATSQTNCASQPIDAIEEDNTVDIRATKEQREIESIYNNASMEELDSKLEGPFHNPVMARYQKGLERSRQSVLLMVPRIQKQDCTFSITIDRAAGYEIIKLLDLQEESSQGRLKQYSNIPKENLPLLGNYLHQGIIRTEKFKSELGPRCTCIYAFTTDGVDNADDVTFSMMFDRHWGYSLRNIFHMRKMELDL
ncbi:hypothetical protein BTUL_0348g00050 [Botrytis tulipae]|uniref:Uncharacterized protein n=1 Tax=Botrytis tulipae TaxID=87230 RepID=A0A4Z1ECC6_9HELO|nr:hypothetical protein BTUL_0348g00050 [Botrytis tulipae]